MYSTLHQNLWNNNNKKFIWNVIKYKIPLIQNKKSEFETKKRPTFIDFTNKMSHFMCFLSAMTLKMRNVGPELEMSAIFVQCGFGIRFLCLGEVISCLKKEYRN